MNERNYSDLTYVFDLIRAQKVWRPLDFLNADDDPCLALVFFQSSWTWALGPFSIQSEIIFFEKLPKIVIVCQVFD